MKKKIVLVGSVFGNHTFHGPFENQEHMDQWLAERVDRRQTISILEIDTDVRLMVAPSKRQTEVCEDCWTQCGGACMPSKVSR